MFQENNNFVSSYKCELTDNKRHLHLHMSFSLRAVALFLYLLGAASQFSVIYIQNALAHILHRIALGLGFST
jgi:hypothetical protein